MGRGSGLGGLIAILGLAFLFSQKKLTAADFFTGGPTPPTTFHFTWSAEQIRDWATDPDAPEEEIVNGWRTVNGRIPTPRGGTIPIPVPFPGGIIDVNKLLKPVGVLTPTYTPPPVGVIDVNAMLVDVDELAVEEARPPRRRTLRPGLVIR